MIEPKEIEITTQNGEARTYIISKLPAIAGREIVTQYPLTGAPKIGEYTANEELMLKMMCYVAIPQESGNLALSNKGLVNNHIPDWETLARIEKAMMEYNCSFFAEGKISSFLEDLAAKVLPSIIKTSMDLLQQSSQADKQPTKNSKKK